jgi:rod shape-determining protein MreC
MTKTHSLSIGLVCAVVAVAVLHVAHVLQPVESGLRGALLPVARVFSSISMHATGFGSAVQNRAELEAQIKELDARIATKSVDYVKLKALEEENTSLRDVAKFLTTTGFDHLGANVIARSTDPQTATLLIDRGSKDGVEVGMAVIIGDGILVGKISAIHENVSTVQLVSDRRSRFAASPAGARRLFGMVEGEGNGVARLTLVPQSEPLTRDDIIVTAGTEDKIPPYLAIAVVNDIEGKPTDPFKTATLQPLAHTDGLNFVIILRPAALNPSRRP